MYRLLNLVDNYLFGHGEPGNVMVLSSQWSKNPKLTTYVCPAILCCDTKGTEIGFVCVSQSFSNPDHLLIQVCGFGKPGFTVLLQIATGKSLDGTKFPNYAE